MQYPVEQYNRSPIPKRTERIINEPHNPDRRDRLFRRLTYNRLLGRAKRKGRRRRLLPRRQETALVRRRNVNDRLQYRNRAFYRHGRNRLRLRPGAGNLRMGQLHPVFGARLDIPALFLSQKTLYHPRVPRKTLRPRHSLDLRRPDTAAHDPRLPHTSPLRRRPDRLRNGPPAAHRFIQLGLHGMYINYLRRHRRLLHLRRTALGSLDRRPPGRHTRHWRTAAGLYRNRQGRRNKTGHRHKPRRRFHEIQPHSHRLAPRLTLDRRSHLLANPLDVVRRHQPVLHPAMPRRQKRMGREDGRHRLRLHQVLPAVYYRLSGPCRLRSLRKRTYRRRRIRKNGQRTPPAPRPRNPPRRPHRRDNEHRLKRPQLRRHHLGHRRS